MDYVREGLIIFEYWTQYSTCVQGLVKFIFIFPEPGNSNLQNVSVSRNAPRNAAILQSRNLAASDDSFVEICNINAGTSQTLTEEQFDQIDTRLYLSFTFT